MPIPAFPLDVVSEIISHLEKDELEEKISEQIEPGKTLSLVCRSWRSLGQGLRWRTVNIETQQFPSLLDHFARFPHLAKLVRTYTLFQTIPYGLDTDDITQNAYVDLIPRFLATLVNLQKFYIQSRMREDLVPILVAASRLGNLTTLVVEESGDCDCSNEFVASFQTGFKKLSALGITAVDFYQSTLPPAVQHDTVRNLQIDKLVIACLTEPAGPSRLANDFLSIVNLTTLKGVTLMEHAACAAFLERLIEYPNLISLELRPNSEETIGNLAQILPILPRLPSLETVRIQLTDLDGGADLESPVSLSEIIACFSPSLRIFFAEQFVFPDFSQIPVRQVGNCRTTNNLRVISTRRPLHTAGGGSTRMLIWGEEKEGKVQWFREELEVVAWE
ncbi:hypothetical protein JCM5350_007327 [Sporobolomyces pararoseus]